MSGQASVMLKETADNCRASFMGSEIEKACPELRKLLDRAACDLEAAASIIHHGLEAKPPVTDNRVAQVCAKVYGERWDFTDSEIVRRVLQAI